MSGYSDQQDCPKCGGQMDTYYDWKPSTYYGEWCYECGYNAETTEGKRMTIAQVNSYRRDQELPLLKKLAKQTA